MEADMQSPSFMALRSGSTSKRARSPESFHERPSKRLSLSINQYSRLDRFRYTHSSEHATPESPAGSSRFPSEDWVHQTDGLTIDSPCFPEQRLPEEQDEDMNMDPDDMTTQAHPHRPDLPPIQTAQINFTQASLFRHHQQRTPLSATSLPTPSGPAVTVLPPTPSMASSSTPYIGELPMQVQTRQLTPVDDDAGGVSAMTLSSPMATFTSPRKQRFTMGPRADCIKCQMSVKGHSVHY